MKKILFVENVASIKARSFYIAAAKAARECGLEFHLAYNAADRTEEEINRLKNDLGVVFHQIDFLRAPYHPGNIKAYKELCGLIRSEGIEYIHCNTPIGGVVGRLAGKKCKAKKVIYQVHGFHFFKGSSVCSWLIFYVIEKLLAKITNSIIAINQEDYARAKKFKLRKNGTVYYVPGVGIDLSQYSAIEQGKVSIKSELGINKECILLISMGDLVKRKNYSASIDLIAQLPDKYHYIICGDGPEKASLQKKAKALHVENRVHFLGYRTDIKNILNDSDIFLFTTKQEGLPRSLMEAMAMGIPCVASNIRGNSDLLENGVNGFLCDNENDYLSAISSLEDRSTYESIRAHALNRIQDFDLETVTRILKQIYEKEILEG